MFSGQSWFIIVPVGLVIIIWKKSKGERTHRLKLIINGNKKIQILIINNKYMVEYSFVFHFCSLISKNRKKTEIFNGEVNELFSLLQETKHNRATTLWVQIFKYSNAFFAPYQNHFTPLVLTSVHKVKRIKGKTNGNNFSCLHCAGWSWWWSFLCLHQLHEENQE